MNNYQKNLFEKFEKFRPKPSWSTYPPYHTGDYLEEYFIKYYYENNISTKKYFIPVCWSSCYINNNDKPILELQQELNKLDQNESYFIVSTHDDAPRELLPKFTTCYSAGGNKGDIPIPLVVSKINKNNIPTVDNKKYLASFIGSITHPIRNKLYNLHKNNKNIHFQCKQWESNVSNQSLEIFLQTTSESYFGLAPRGYGKTSYRLYEIMQIGAVPVYISDQFWLPWKNEIDWNEICILFDENNIDFFDIRLKKEIYSGEYSKKIEKIKEIYDAYFTIKSVTKKIIEECNR